MSESLICLVYTSRSIRPPEEADLVALLEAARDNNARLGVTGVLVYGDERFVQVLEGEDEAVHEVFSHIATDRRHYAVQILADEPIVRRAYAHWSMGFRRTGSEALEGFDARVAEALDRAGSLPKDKVALDDLMPIVGDLTLGAATS